MPRIKRFSAFRCVFFGSGDRWPHVNTPALLGRYSRCTQEAALNTTSYWARGGDRDNGSGDPRKASRACPDQAVCLQGLRGRLGGRHHSRAAGEGWRGEGQPSSAFPPGEAGVSFLYFTPRVGPPLLPSAPPPPFPVFSFIFFFCLKIFLPLLQVQRCPEFISTHFVSCKPQGKPQMRLMVKSDTLPP